MDIHEFLKNGSVLGLGNGRVVVGSGEREGFSQQSANELFYFQDFFLTNKTPWHHHRFQQEMTVAELLELVEGGCCDPIEWQPLQIAEFDWIFSDLQERILRNNLKKGVPYVFERANRTIAVGQLQRSLCAALKMAQQFPLYVYGTWTEGRGVLGATPEILFSTRDRQLSTMACAGTVVGDGIDDKLLHEHQVVVEAIVEQLSSFGEVVVGELEMLKLRRFNHLLTPIHVMLHDDAQFESIVRALHPTPALGAYPKEEGMRWLLEIEKVLPRGYFGAPVGYVDAHGDGHYCVAIRNMQWDQEAVILSAGCGVVKESCREAEWRELQLKLGSIKELLQLQTEPLPIV